MTGCVCVDRVLDFLGNIEAFIVQENNPDAGVEHNFGEGLGILLMKGASFAVSWYNQDRSDDDMGAQVIRKTMAIVIGIITSPITFVGAVIKIISKELPHSNQIRTDAIIARTDRDRIDQVYDLLQSIHDGCKAIGLHYIKISGTELGSERHGGIIPWDDDGDLAIMKEDEEKIEALQDILSQQGVDISFNAPFQMYQMQYSDKKWRENYPEASEKAQVDIFLFDKMGDGRVTFASDLQRANFPKEWFTEEEMAETIEKLFGPVERGLYLNGIKNSHEYLKRYYGQDCLEYGIATHHHVFIFGIPVSVDALQTEKVQIVDRNCAQGRRWTGASSMAKRYCT